MMGLEPTTFCMASASDVRARSRRCAQTACLQVFVRASERDRPERTRRTLPFLPHLVWASVSPAAAVAPALAIMTARTTIFLSRQVRPARTRPFS